MTRTAAVVSTYALLVSAAGAGVTTAPARQTAPPAVQQQPQSTFRSGVIIVPVDVRVLDRDGKPVTDLQQGDFTIVEDGVPQEIRHFSARGLVSAPVPAGSKPAVRTRSSSPIQEQSARIFLILLGRGRLQHPSKGVDAAIHMVRDRLLPQDQVAVMAYNRATDFTTDRALIVEVLDRFKRRHEDIEAMFRHQTSGLPALYGSREPSSALQREIDALFRAPGGPAARAVTPSPLPERERIAADSQRGIDDALRAEIAAGRPATVSDTFDLLAGERAGLPFDAFVSTSVQTLQDLGNLYTGIEYLRYLEGEKHLVFVTEQGFFLPRSEPDVTLAARANHARVVIDTIQTGGLDGGPTPMDSRPLIPTSIQATRLPPPVASTAFTAMDMARIQVLKSVSNLTGGLSATRQYAQPAVDRIDTATRFGYLLGYQPSNQARDRRYRRIAVRVNRPGVTVLFRHGYYADDVLPPLDRRVFLTNRRISAAGYYGSNITDIRVTMSATLTKDPRAVEVRLAVNVDASRVVFATAEDRHIADLDIVIYAADAKERIVGESRHKMDLKLKEETYQRYLREGIPFDVTMRAAAPPKYVKVIVYDYAADLLGSSILTLK